MATYQTQQGDTWDLISFRAYGTEFYTDELFKANLKYSDIAVFSAGYVVEIPEIIAAAPASVAPWDRETVAETASETAPEFSFSRDRGPSYRILERYVAIMTKNARLHFKEGA